MLDYEDIDTHGQFATGSPGMFTCSVSGWYRATGHVMFAANATGIRALAVYTNTSKTYVRREWATANAPKNVEATAYYYLAAGNTLKLSAYHEAGVTLNTGGTGDIPYSLANLAVEWVGP